jgi:hypothetical protein
MRTIKQCVIAVTTTQLWPHEETFGEDQVLRDAKFYVKDGSFTVKTTGAKNIITSEQTV